MQVEESRPGSGDALYDTLLELAIVYALDLRPAASSAVYQRLASTLEAEGRLVTLDAAVLFNNWSAGLQDAGAVVQSLTPAERAVQTANAADAQEGASLSMLTTYASALAGVGRYDEAERVFDAAVVKARSAGVAPRLQSLLTSLVLSAVDAGHLERAERFAAEARALSLTDPLAQSLTHRFELRLAEAAGRRDAAIEHARQAVALALKGMPTKTARIRLNLELARTLSRDERSAEALALAEESLQLARESQGDLSHSSHVGRALLEVATAKCGAGDTAGARAAVSQAVEHLRLAQGPAAFQTRRAEWLAAGLDLSPPRCSTPVKG